MKFSKQLIACAVAAGLAAPMSAFATNGYFAHGYSAKNKGLAGSGSALPQDAGGAHEQALAERARSPGTIGRQAAVLLPRPAKGRDQAPGRGTAGAPSGREYIIGPEWRQA